MENPFGTTKPVVKVCPVCGGTMLSVDVMVTTIQDNHGNWVIEATPEDLNDEFTNPNIVVRCLNEHCGPILYKGKVYKFKNDMDLFIFWLDQICEESPEVIDEMRQGYLNGVLTPISIQAYAEFMDDMVHDPWVGHMNEVLILDM